MMESFKDNYRAKHRTLERGEEDRDPGLKCTYCESAEHALDSQAHCLRCTALSDLRTDLHLTSWKTWSPISGGSLRPGQIVRRRRGNRGWTRGKMRRKGEIMEMEPRLTRGGEQSEIWPRDGLQRPAPAAASGCSKTSGPGNCFYIY